MTENWKLSPSDRGFFKNLYTIKKANSYIDVIELRNQGLSFREIARRRKTNVSSAHMAYKNAIKALAALQAYPLQQSTIQPFVTNERQAVIKEIEELLVDDPPTPNEETYLRNQVRARYRAELRAKLVEMKEE